jgi:P27 family predicted phage terminase small subunit
MTDEIKHQGEVINEFLESKGQLEDVDTTLIDELLFNIELIAKCKQDIEIEGYKLNITQRKNGKPYYVKNQAFVAYQSCLRNINTILTSLGLTVRERQKLKLALSDPDNFDSIMSM